MDLMEIVRPTVLVPWALGMVFGVFVGSTPGLTATMAVALIVPFSYQLGDPIAALAMIIGVSFTAIFAGDIPATLFRIPGTPASAAATLDSHEMAKQGHGGLALTIDLFCSSLGGLVGVVLLALLAPQVARFALRFSDFENFWLAVLGLGLAALVSRGRVLLGLLTAAMGILISTIGIDFTGAQRFVFHDVSWLPEILRDELQGGLHFIPVMIGLFGFAEVMRNIRDGVEDSSATKKPRFRLAIGEALATIRKRFGVFMQSSVLGVFIGALPGAGADIAAWAAYGFAQRTSRRGSRFGDGEPDGVIAPTSANNAAVAGAWIPALIFGVPGDAVTAIVVSAFITFNIRPGPAIFEENGEQMTSLFAIAMITQLLLVPAGLMGIYAFGFVTKFPRRFVLSGVLVFSIVGAYALHNSLFDVYVMFAFGILGYFLDRIKAPTAPLILGLILGPLLEERLRAGLMHTKGDFTPFLTRPICMALIAFLVVAAVSGTWFRPMPKAET